MLFSSDNFIFLFRGTLTAVVIFAGPVGALGRTEGHVARSADGMGSEGRY